MPLIRAVSLALVCFDKEILPYGHKFCNRESGLQPTPCEPLGKGTIGNEKGRTVVEYDADMLFGGRVDAAISICYG